MNGDVFVSHAVYKSLLLLGATGEGVVRQGMGQWA